MSQWEKVTFTLPAGAAEIFTEYVISATGRGVETDTAGRDYIDKLESRGVSARITAWFTEDEVKNGLLEEIENFAASIARNVIEGAPAIHIEREVQRDEEWAEKWKEFFKPVRAGRRFIIRPTWESAQKGPEDIEIIIDPGQAFGVGTHATTSLMLASMEWFFEEWLFEQKGEGSYRPEVIDVGTGTGILGIAACKLGASNVRAIDIDPEAVRAANKNAKTNSVSSLFHADTTPITEIEEDFDLVLANIDKKTLTSLCDDLTRLTRHDGILMVSGILSTQQDYTKELFSQRGFETIRALRGSGAGDSGSDQWSCLAMQIKRHV